MWISFGSAGVGVGDDAIAIDIGIGGGCLEGGAVGGF